jgi:hypothetical protein
MSVLIFAAFGAYKKEKEKKKAMSVLIFAAFGAFDP